MCVIGSKRVDVEDDEGYTIFAMDLNEYIFYFAEEDNCITFNLI